jgi:subtilisin family serine protease
VKKLDPRLRHVLQTTAAVPPESAVVTDLAERVGLAQAEAAPQVVEVLVRCADDAGLRELAASGIDVHAPVPGAQAVATVRLQLAELERLEALEGVERIESSRQLFPELDLSLEAAHAVVVHEARSAVDGAGALVGIIDGGVDWTHPSLREPDGSSRILALWDQAAAPVPGGPVPFGRQYTKADLDAALAHSRPFALVPHQDRDGHGTHVAGIAVGNGRASDGRFTGVAPAAGLLVVALDIERGLTLGRSTKAHQALEWIVRLAAGRPVAINLSQGMNGGGHAGETVLETVVDNLARRPGVVIVKSAGNEHRQRTHAGGQVPPAGAVALDLIVQPGNVEDDVIEVWYGGGDRISVAIEPPGGPVLATVVPGEDTSQATRKGNAVTLDWELDTDGTGATRLVVILTTGTAGSIQSGTWRLHLRGEQVADGRFDAWIERAAALPGEQTRFSPASADPSRTITIPGTCRRVVTVASWATRPRFDFGPVAPGDLSSFSSHGPTRTGLRKPDLAAPGEEIASARSASGHAPQLPDEFHTLLAGTSMAAPHVTGAAALLLSLRPGLTGEQAGQLLTRTARRDDFTGLQASDQWGGGKLDVAAAVAELATATFPRISGARVDGTTVRWTTDVPSTGTVRYHTSRRLLQLGLALGELTEPAAGTDHVIDLAQAGPGALFCEIQAVQEQGWWSIDDDNGRTLEVRATATDETAQPLPQTPPKVGTRPGVQATDEEPRIRDLRLDVPAAADGAVVRADARLRADVRFSLASPSAHPGGRSCAVHLLAHELAVGRVMVLDQQTRRLKVGQRKYAATLRFDAPGPGRYRLLATVVLPEEDVAAVTLGPTVEVPPPDSAPTKMGREEAASVIQTEGEQL